ncbi:MAG TPA: squalene/phytoene synthase family protein [Hyphomicrobiaceae bacterium]|nr:squalene/phytoene synthase family protein [Hyphomicrobiaceae bacterium]
MSEAPLDALRDTAVARESDRYFAATLAPAAIRYDLVVLAAFAAELANIPLQVREPLAGEIRLQWWRDALAANGAGTAAGHPVAVPLRAVIARHALPAGILDAVIDSYADTLHGDRPADEAALAAHMAAREGGLFWLAAQIAGSDHAGDIRDVTQAAGIAYGISRTLVRLPAEGVARLPIPRSLLSDDDLDQVGTGAATPRLASAISALGHRARAALSDVVPQLAKMSRVKRLPFVPLAMVRPNLRALETWVQRGGTASIEPLPISRLLRITWAHARGRF